MTGQREVRSRRATGRSLSPRIASSITAFLSAPRMTMIVSLGAVVSASKFMLRRGKGASGRYAEELAPLLDIVEVFNGRLHPGNLNEPAEELAARWSKARGAGSDAHTVGEVAGAYVEVEEHANEPKALLAALEGARVRGATSPWSVHLASTWAKIHKRLPGGSDELR